MVNFKSLAKMLSQIEAGSGQSLSLLKDLYGKRRGVPILGITGLPGSGKSTIVDQLIPLLRGQDKKVGVIAVDPSSPFTGGALLGDRVRMQRHTSDEGVFIRSLGSRGAHGGLSHATRHIALALDAYGFDYILVETVGVGQTELDIMGLATTTVVVLVPEAGDAIQTLKAGLLEIASIFVVNKADRPGADAMQKMLQAMATVPVLLTQADQGKGVEELWETIQKLPTKTQNQEVIRRNQFLDLVGDIYKQKIQERLLQEKRWEDLTEKVAQDTLNPFEALEKILRET